MYLTGNQAMENVVERRQGSMHSSPQHEMKATLRLQVPAALIPKYKSLVSIELETVLVSKPV
jgi:hypothetical protein